MRVDRGEVVGLIGPNGAGKSTCFNMLSGIIKAESGDVLIDGISVTNLPIHIRALRAFACSHKKPQFQGVIRSRQSKVASELHQTRQKKQDKDGAINNLLIQFGLKEIKERRGKFLSGGEEETTGNGEAFGELPKICAVRRTFRRRRSYIDK